MADNEIELIGKIEADIDGADSYANSVSDIASGTITAASSILYLGGAIDAIKSSLKNVDISKLSQISQMKFSNLEQLWNKLQANQYKQKNRSQIHFEQLFGTFNSRSEQNKAEQFIKSITDHNATGQFLDSTQKGEAKAAVLEEYNQANRILRDKILREAVGYRGEITSSNSKTSREAENDISLLKEAFKNIQRKELSDYNNQLQKEKLELEAENRQEESDIKSDYERKKAKIDSEYLSKMTEAQNKLSYATDDAEKKRDSRMGALLSSLETSKGVSYDSPESIQKRIDEIGKINPEYQRLKDELTKINILSKQRVAEIGDKFAPGLTEIKKDSKRGQDSKEYIELHKKMIEYQEHAKRHYQRQIDTLKAGKNNNTEVAEAIELEQLLKKYNDESSAILKDYNKEIRKANKEYNRRSTNARNTQAKDTHEAVIIRERDDKARVDLYGELIKNKEAQNTSRLSAFKTQQQLTSQAFNESLLEKEINLKENQKRSLQEFNTVVQDNVDALNKEIGTTKTLISSKKEEDKLNAKLDKAEKKANKYKGMSIRDALRDTLIRNEDMMMYRGGFKGFALRAAQNGWNRFADKKGISNQIFKGKEIIDGEEVSTRGVNPVSAAVTTIGGIGAALAETWKLAKAIDRFNATFEESFKTIEVLKTNLSVVYGSQNLANNTFSDISAYAIKSPFGVSQLTEMATLFRQSGVYSTDLLDTLKMIGDTAGGNMTKMRNVATDYARIIAMGKANARELRTFAAAGIPIYKELQKSLGITNTEVLQRARKGEIKSTDIEQAFLNMTGKGGVFENAVTTNANTLMTRQQNLQDRVMFTKAKVGEASAESGVTAFKMSLMSNLWDSIAESPIVESWNNFAKSREDKRTWAELALSGRNLEGKDGKELEQAEEEYIEYWKKRKNFLMEQEEAFLQNSKEVKRLNKRHKEIENLLNGDVYIPTEEMIKLLAESKEIDKKLSSITQNKEYQVYGYQKKLETDLQKISDMFGKFGDNEFSSKNQSFIQQSYFDKTAWGALERVKKEDEELAKINELLRKQNQYGITDGDTLSWIGNYIARQSNGEEKLPDFTSTKEVSELLSSFYSGETLNLSSPVISRDVIDTLLRNKNNIDALRNSTSLNIDNDIWSEWDKLFGDLALSGINLNKATSIQEKTRVSESIRTAAGRITDWIDTIEDEALKTILSSAFMDTSDVVLSNEQENAIKKHNHKIYAKFWERYAVKTLGISLDGLIEGRSALSQFIENRDRTTGTAIAVAMLKEKNIDQTLNRNLVYGANGFNLAASRRNLELGAIDSRSSIAITQAYLATLQSSIDTMANFLGGMPFTAEDAEKLYDPTMAYKLGYENKDQFISAFTDATKAGGEALEIFNTKLKGSISAILEETKKRKENVEIIVKAKQTSENVKSKVASAQTEALALAIFSGNTKVNSIYETKSLSALSEAITFYKQSLGKNGQLASDADVLAFMQKGQFSSGSTTPITPPKKTGILAEYESYRDFRDARVKEIRDARGDGKSYTDLTDIDVDSIIKEWKAATAAYEKAISDNQKSFAEAREKDVQIQSAAVDITKGAITIDNINEETNIRKSFDNRGVLLNGRRVNAVKDEGYFDDTKLGYFRSEEFRVPVYATEDGRRNTRKEQLALNRLGASNYLMDNYVTILGTDRYKDVYQEYAKLRESMSQLTREGPFGYEEITADGKSLKEQKEDVKEMLALIGEYNTRAEAHHRIMEGMKQDIASTLTGTAASGFTSTISILGEALRDSADASEKLTKNFKSLMQSMSASIGDAMVQAGLQTIINAGTDKGQWAKGMALLAAGGGLSLVSGYLEEADEDNDNKDYERLNKIKDDLKDLLRQAREDSIYYENTVRHKKALSTNASLSGSTHSVNDAIISPSGNVITTSPRDYLIATTNPHSLSRSSAPTVNFNVIDQSTGVKVNAPQVSYNAKDNTLDITAMIESKMNEFIATDKSDRAFALREQRKNGKYYVG